VRRNPILREWDLDNFDSVTSSDRGEKVVGVEKTVSGCMRSFAQRISQREVKQMVRRLVANGLLHKTHDSFDAIGIGKHLEVKKEILASEEECCVLSDLGSSKEAQVLGAGIVLNSQVQGVIVSALKNTQTGDGIRHDPVAPEQRKQNINARSELLAVRSQLSFAEEESKVYGLILSQPLKAKPEIVYRCKMMDLSR